MTLDGQTEVKTFVDTAIAVEGPIPHVIPFYRNQNRRWSGDDVFRQKSSALENALQVFEQDGKDAALKVVQKWGNTYYDLPVAVACFEDQVNIQRESGLLQGIAGVTIDGYLAVSADYVRNAVSDDAFKKYFKDEVYPQVSVQYFADASGTLQEAIATNVVLFPYDGESFSLTPDQFRSLKSSSKKRGDFLYGNDVNKGDIIVDNQIQYPHSAILPEDSSIVERTFKFNKKAYGYDTNMGLFLPEEPHGEAKVRALYAGRLVIRARLNAGDGLGDDGSRPVGVVENSAAGGATK